MADLSNHVRLTITRNSTGPSRAGFGVEMYLSGNADWATDLIRFYSSLSAAAVDFPSTSSPEYLFVQQAMAQNPHPRRVAIGRIADARRPTQKYLLEVAAVRNSYPYKLNVRGDGVTATDISSTSDSAATQAEVANALAAALNAVVGKNFTATFLPSTLVDFTFTGEADDDTLTATAHGLQTGDGPVQVSNSGGALPGGLTALTDYYVIRTGANTFQLATSRALALAGTAVALSTDGTGTQTLDILATTTSPYGGVVVTGDAAGEWFGLEVVNREDLALANTTADPGIATDLEAIKKVSSDWYALVTGYNGNAPVLAAAAWVESAKRLYLPDLNDTRIVTTAVGSSDTMDDLKTLSYERTGGAYHPRPWEMFAGAWFGRVLPKDPGSVTFALKELAGVTADVLTDTERLNLTNKRGNGYEDVAGVGVTFRGMRADGDFLDVTRDIDKLDDDMRKDVFTALVGVDKVPFTAEGMAMVEGPILGALRRAVRDGILAADPEPSVTLPELEDIDPADKAARILDDVSWSATLANSIHEADIDGTVSL